MLYHDAACRLIDHPYAIMEFVEGELMRNVILSGDEEEIAQCAFSAGGYLNQLRQIKFSQAGFFQKGLEIMPFNCEDEHIAETCLSDPEVQASLGPDLGAALNRLFDRYPQFMPSKNQANLSHADFDPANMLVRQVSGRYQVSAVLDWEFAFSCSYFLDMGMFLRYSHRLPSNYETQFIAGVTAAGNPLPEYWKKSAKFMDAICLLNLLYWNPKSERPKLNADVVGLLQHTVDHWHQF
jgi:aminoglycoside phosphotransferase (APT) family kinase protein